MAKATSPASGQPYGIRRVCEAWGVSRSSFYAAQVLARESALPVAPPARRGPKNLPMQADPAHSTHTAEERPRSRAYLLSRVVVFQISTTCPSISCRF